METFLVEPSGLGELVPCDACGDKTRSVRGFVRGGGGETAYAVQWTDGRLREHGAHWDLLMAADPEHTAISLEFRITAGGPGFMVIDAGGRPTWNAFPNVRRLDRDQVVGTPLAEVAFAILDAIWVQDERLEGLRGDAA